MSKKNRNKRQKSSPRPALEPASASSPACALPVTPAINHIAAQRPVEPVTPLGLSGQRCLEVSSHESPSHGAAVEVPLEKRLVANRANAQLSTGPRTEVGKAKSCLNAVKTGLTGQTVLLPTDDAAEYERHILAYEERFAPVGQEEIDLVQSIADTSWRLNRVPSLENGIYAVGHMELAESFEDHDPAIRPHLILVAVHLKYEKQIRNLQLQEARLGRRREKEIAELRRLQQERIAAGPASKKPATEPATTRPAPSASLPGTVASASALPGHSQNGFVFPTALATVPDQHPDTLETSLYNSKAA